MNKPIVLLYIFLCACNYNQSTEFNSNKGGSPLLQEKKGLNNIAPKIIQKQNQTDCSKVSELYETPTSLTDNSGKTNKDTDSTIQENIVFKPCREYKYVATFYSDGNKLISENEISIMATGKRWKVQPEFQDEVIIKYRFKKEDVPKINEYQINKALGNATWIKETKTGVIDTEEQIWMHPFRHNQYKFTQVAPFPELKFPLKIGKTWKGELSIYKGWGDWNNSNGSFLYTVEAKEDIQTLFGQTCNCWKIKSNATYSFGKSFLNFWFNEKLGFVKMYYRNYKGQMLYIELIDIIEY